MLTSQVDRGKFLIHLDDDPANKFAKTFAAKATHQNLWPVLGMYEDNLLAGAISWTVSKREPRVGNLQLLHTFAAYRRKGIGRALCQLFLENLVKQSVEYWRVSSEIDAVKFYVSLGIRFAGRQKSGCLLAVAKRGPTFETCDYNPEEPIIKKILSRKGKGSCVEFFSPLVSKENL